MNRTEKVLGRLVGYILITLCVAALAVGAFILIKNEWSEFQNPSPERLSEKFFAACVMGQEFDPRHKEINKKMGITKSQIEAYCRCYGKTLTGLATIEERRYFALNDEAPSGFNSKVLKAADSCFSVIDQTQ